MRYEFLIEGQVSDTIVAAFPNFRVAQAPGGTATSISGVLRDQSDVRGMIARLDDLGLRIVEMRKLPES